MKLSFKLTPDELTFLSMEASSYSPRYKKVLVKSRIFLSVAFLIIALSFSSLEDNVTCYATLIFGAIFVIFYPKIIRRTWRSGFEKYFKAPSSERFLETQTWTMDSKKLSVSQAGIKSEFQWKAFSTMREYPHYYALNLESEQGLLLPKSVLKNKKQEKEAFSFFKRIPSEQVS